MRSTINSSNSSLHRALLRRRLREKNRRRHRRHLVAARLRMGDTIMWVEAEFSPLYDALSNVCIGPAAAGHVGGVDGGRVYERIEKLGVRCYAG